jgi:hypothetical protein
MAIAQGFKESTKPARVIRGKEISPPWAKKQAGEVQEFTIENKLPSVVFSFGK